MRCALTHGYWEAKDESDDIDVETEKKLKKGYPADNILFEDSITAVLLQNNTEVMRVSMKMLLRLINWCVDLSSSSAQS